MPSHRRTRSSRRGSSLPPLSPPQSPRSPKLSGGRIAKTPVVPSLKRKHGLQGSAELKYTSQMQNALASLPVQRSSPPTGLRSPFVLQTSPAQRTIKEEEEDSAVFVIHRPDFSPLQGPSYSSRYIDPDMDWQQDLLDPTPVLTRGKRPGHRHKRSSSAAFAPSIGQSRLHTPLPTILSATPSPSISAAPSPAAKPLALAPEADFGLLVPPPNDPTGWPGESLATPSSHGMPTPAFSTPALSPSSSSAAGSPFEGRASTDCSLLQTPNTPRTPYTPRPVPE